MSGVQTDKQKQKELLEKEFQKYGIHDELALEKLVKSNLWLHVIRNVREEYINIVMDSIKLTDLNRGRFRSLAKVNNKNFYGKKKSTTQKLKSFFFVVLHVFQKQFLFTYLDKFSCV